MVANTELDSSFFFKSTGSKFLRLREVLNSLDTVSESLPENTVIENYLFIALYSLWESEVYNVVQGLFQNHFQELVSDKFVREYYTNLLSSKSKIVKEKINSLDYVNLLKIEEVIRLDELFFDTNNLWYASLTDLLVKCDFRTENLSKYFDKMIDSGLLTDKLREIPLESGVDGKLRPNRDVKSYVDFLVSTRNSIAHSFKVPTGAQFDKTLWFNLLDLFEQIFLALDNFLKDQLLEKMYFKESPKIVGESEFELVMDKKAKDRVLKINLKVPQRSGDVLEENDYCVFFNKKDTSGYQKIKKFKVVKKEVYSGEGFDYRIELEEVYNAGGLKRSSSSGYLLYFIK